MKSLASPVAVVLASLVASGIVGCRSSQAGATASDAKSSSTMPAAKNAAFAVPPESRFAALRYGMGMTEVEDLVGAPTDVDHRLTGKAFNPFYYGTDTNRQTWLYQGAGRLVFNSRGRLIEAKHDAGERGYR